jgi:hypothetical protein
MPLDLDLEMVSLTEKAPICPVEMDWAMARIPLIARGFVAGQEDAPGLE